MQLTSVSTLPFDTPVFKQSKKNPQELELKVLLPFAVQSYMSKIIEMDFLRDEFYESFKPVLLLGRLTNVLPITGIRSTTSSDLQFRWKSWWTFFSVLLLLITILTFCAQIYDCITNTPRSVRSIAVSVQTTIYILMVVFAYSYFLIRSKDLIKLIQFWKPTCDQLLFDKPDTSLRSHIILIVLVIWGWAILENLLYDYTAILNGAKGAGLDSSILEKYFLGAHGKGAGYVISYSPEVSVLLFIYDKYRVYTWNFMDILIVTTSRALCFKFKCLYLHCDALLKSWAKKDQLSFSEKHFMTEIRKEFLILCKLVDEVDKILNPIIFFSYCVTIYCISVHLFRWITTPEKATYIESLYTLISFMQFFARSIMVTHFGGQIHSYAAKVVKTLQHCPDSKYTALIERLERMMMLNPVGLTGLNFFLVKKEFLISIVNFIFTFEIVLLQTSAAVGVLGNP